jgi:hypothetical protein
LSWIGWGRQAQIGRIEEGAAELKFDSRAKKSELGEVELAREDADAGGNVFEAQSRGVWQGDLPVGVVNLEGVNNESSCAQGGEVGRDGNPITFGEDVALAGFEAQSPGGEPGEQTEGESVDGNSVAMAAQGIEDGGGPLPGQADGLEGEQEGGNPDK